MNINNNKIKHKEALEMAIDLTYIELNNPLSIYIDNILSRVSPSPEKLMEQHYKLIKEYEDYYE